RITRLPADKADTQCLLRLRDKRASSNGAAERDNKFSTTHTDGHATLPWEVMPTQWPTLPRFDRGVCGRSAYPPRLSVIADMPVRRASAKRRPEQVQQYEAKTSRSPRRRGQAASAAPQCRASSLS